MCLISIFSTSTVIRSRIFVGMNGQKIITGMLNSLLELQKVEFEERNFYDCGEKVLAYAYNAGISKVELDGEEQLRIGSLMKENLKKLDSCIFNLGYGFDENYGPRALMLRSGLQYILDNFKDFPTGDGKTLADAVNYFAETESLETFDEALKRWKEDNTVGWDKIAHKAEDVERPAKIPVSHHWWH